MTDRNLEKYLESIKHELEKLKETKFTGNRAFRLNFKDGMVANMNIESHMSVKL